MRYVWKFLSLISGLAVVLFSIPTAISMRIHLWLCQKANPDYNPFADMMQKMSRAGPDPKDAEQMGKAIAEMMQAMAPAVVAGAKASVDKTMESHHHSAWAEPPAPQTVNPVLPRIPGIPTVNPPPLAHQTSGHCCHK